MSRYYDIDDILADAEPVPCIFEHKANDLGYLDECNDEKDINENTRLELPFWLASKLACYDTPLVNLFLPKAFMPKFRTILLADPAVANLKDRSPFFYELGMKLAQLTNDETIGSTMQECLGKRYMEIIIRSSQWRSADFATFASRLSNLEQSLFETKYNAHQNFNKWYKRHNDKLKAADSVTQYKNRKRRSSGRTRENGHGDDSKKLRK